MIEKSIAEGNSDPAVLLQAAANFLASGEINRAIEVLESLPEAQQVGQKDLLLVLALLRKGDEDAARERVMSVVERSPDSADAQRLLGSFHLAVKEPEKARAAFESALRIDPDNVASMMNLVSIDLSENKPDQAEARLQSYLERKPGDLSTLTALARLAEKAGDLEKGVALLEQAREANPASLTPALTLAQYYMRSGNTELARERANQAMRIDESSGGAQLVLGMILLKDEQPSEAVPYFEKAIELSPKSAVAFFQLGRAQAATGMADASTKSYRKAIEVDPGYFPALAALVGADVERGDLNSALQVAEQLLQAYPENSEPHILKADVLVARKEYTAALQALDDAAALKESRLIAGKRFDIRRKMGASEPWTELQDWLADHPDDTKIRLGLAQAYMQAGKTDLAIQNYEQVMEMAPNADVASVLAMAHSSGGNYDVAASWLEKANMLKPGDMALQAALAGIEAKRGNIDTAVTKVRQLRRDFPDAEQLNALEGEILLAAKDYKGSIKALDRALESDPSAGLIVRRFNAGKGDGDEEAWRILENWYSKNPKDDLVGVQLAQEYSSREWHDEAIDVYQTMLKNNPDNFVTQNNIAWSYMTRGNAGDLKKALDSAASAYQRRPDIAAIADTYGWILLQDGQNKKALEILQPAAQGSKADPEILYHYAAALDANDRDSEALKIVNRALASDATFTSRDDAEILQRRLSE
ncbi:MAG: tetratricopeptide repeat protein [Gammaproteobacteria bacterium]|nr:tetratricopeptide repeat protein [Gammaproteobacteria bacterium]